MKKAFYLLCSLSFCVNATAQDSLGVRHGGTVIKTALTTPFEPDGLVQIDLEQRILPKISLQGSFGYGYPGFSIFRQSLYQTNGVRQFRGEVRFYPGRASKAHAPSFLAGRYWAFESYHKDLNVLRNWQIPREDASGSQNPQPVGRQSPVQRQTLGFNVKFGRQFAPLRSNERLLLDLYVGAGIRFTHTQHRDWLLDGYQSGFEPDRLSTNGRKTLPSVALGLKLGYIL